MKSETWVEILVPPLEKGDPGPLQMVEGKEFMGARISDRPLLVRHDYADRPSRWWRRVR